LKLDDSFPSAKTDFQFLCIEGFAQVIISTGFHSRNDVLLADS
jgi:hypothetical protein